MCREILISIVVTIVTGVVLDAAKKIKNLVVESAARRKTIMNISAALSNVLLALLLISAYTTYLLFSSEIHRYPTKLFLVYALFLMIAAIANTFMIKKEIDKYKHRFRNKVADDSPANTYEYYD